MAGEQSTAREVSEQEKALAKDWQKRIEAALSNPDRKEAEKNWKDNRTLLRGKDPASGKKLRTNLHFANLAAMRPQVYAKDPEFAVAPTKAVPEDRIPMIQAFAATAEQVVGELLVRRAKLKRRAKRILTSAYTCSIGWWKLCWQEDRKQDPLIVNQIKDAQDNLQRLERLREEVGEDEPGNDAEVEKLKQTISGLQAQPEITISRGLALDFVMPDDMLVLDASVREITDYERSEALANGVWMTRCQYKERFGADAKKARVYREAKAGDDGKAPPQAFSGTADKDADLLRVWEIWEQASGRVFTICEGEEGFCREPYSPTWTGKRWYPFFLLAFNEVDGQFLPLSDIDLTTEVVREYNKTRDDFERDRRDALPFTVVRKGGTLTPDDVERIRNRNGNDIILVDGVGSQPLSADIQAVTLGTLNPINYDTTAPRQDMEMLVGGGDAARGSVLKAKTATEAEILSQGLRGRSAERTDTIEDLLSEVGSYALEVCLRKLSADDVRQIAGPEAVWPELSTEEVFRMVTLTVRGGSTGRPDRLQEQDRWTKLLPVIEKAMGQVVQMRQAGMHKEAEAVVELVRETLRRFDERVDIERFLPAPKDGEDPGQGQIPPELQQQMQQLQDMLGEAQKKLADRGDQYAADIEKAKIAGTAKVQAAMATAGIAADATIEAAMVKAGQPAPLPVVMPDGLGMDGSSMHEGMEGAGEYTEAPEPGMSPDDAPMMPAPVMQPVRRAPMPAAAPAGDASLASVLVPALLQMQQQIASLAVAMGQNKQPMQVVHERDPVTNQIIRSVQKPLTP